MTEHLCSTHDPTCYRCDLRRDEYLRELEREVAELRDDVATLRHAADLQAETMAERDAEVQRLQALIDAYAEAVRTGTADDWHSAYGALLAAATPQRDTAGEPSERSEQENDA